MIIGITGHKGILAKSIINFFKKSKKTGYKISLYKHNVLHFRKLEKWLKKVDIIVHLAAVTSINQVNKNKNYAKKVNFNATKSLVKLLNNSNSNKKLIFISSSHVYLSSKNRLTERSDLKPISYYGKLKIWSEKEITNNLSNYIIVRLFSYYSKKQSKDFLIPSVIEKIKNSKGKKLRIKNYNHIRDISSVEYVSKQISNLIFSDYNGIINCGSGKGLTIKKIGEKIAAIKFNKKITFDKRFQTREITKLVCNNSKLKEITGIKDEDDLFKFL